MKQKIRKVLELRLAAWAAAQPLPVAVAWEGIAFTPRPDTPYTQAWLMPAAPQNPNVDLTRQAHKGYFQVSIFCPADGAGTALLAGLSSSLSLSYPIGDRLPIDSDYLQLTRHPEISTTRVDGNYLRDDVMIYYRFDTTNF